MSQSVICNLQSAICNLRAALKRGNGETVAVCGHYGTTAIIRDFPFAPCPFLVPHVSLLLCFLSGCAAAWRGKWFEFDSTRVSGRERNEPRTAGFSAALVRVHSHETMERERERERRSELKLELDLEEEVTEEVTTGV